MRFSHSPTLPLPKPELHFSVKDTGIGISPEQQSRLFGNAPRARALSR